VVKPTTGLTTAYLMRPNYLHKDVILPAINNNPPVFVAPLTAGP